MEIKVDRAWLETHRAADEGQDFTAGGLVPDKDRWVGMDLDSTVMHHEDEELTGFGEPIPAMADIVHGYLRLGVTVKIFTARAYEWQMATEDQLRRELYDSDILPIKKWCRKVFGVDLEVTCLKAPHLLELYDDRAIAVEKNTGQIICAHPTLLPYFNLAE